MSAPQAPAPPTCAFKHVTRATMSQFPRFHSTGAPIISGLAALPQVWHPSKTPNRNRTSCSFRIEYYTAAKQPFHSSLMPRPMQPPHGAASQADRQGGPRRKRSIPEEAPIAPLPKTGIISLHLRPRKNAAPSLPCPPNYVHRYVYTCTHTYLRSRTEYT